MKISHTFHRHTPIKSKIGGKILFKKHVQMGFYRQFSIVKFSLRPNECIVLIICGVKYS